MANQFKYVIVGGGRAGASAVEGIRRHDQSGSISIFNKEPRLPYDRPPLSKGLWLGKTTLEELAIHPEEYYQTSNIHLFLDTEIVEILPGKRVVHDAQGVKYSYEKLLLATGGTPRVLSFGGDAVQYFRTVDDYQAVLAATEEKDHFLFLGGGFIAAELSAALLMREKRVTLVFPEANLLHKVLPSDLATYVTRYYTSKGVNILSGDVATGIERSGGENTVTTKAGKKIAADLVIGAIGLNLHTEIPKRAGLHVENGVVVNEHLQSSDPHIYVAGDIASFPSRALGKHVRMEHWDNARAQGKHAGENMAGANKPFEYLPFFYSDLFDLGFEAVGELDARLETVADWKEEFREGIVYYLSDGVVRGVLLWNVWEKVDAARDLVTSGTRIKSPAALKGRL